MAPFFGDDLCLAAMALQLRMAARQPPFSSRMTSRSDKTKLLTMLQALPEHELADILNHFKTSCTRMQPPALPPEVLAAAQNWFRQRADLAATSIQIRSRLRMWFIFMLLRHGALRLSEVFNLRAQDLDFATCEIQVNGAHAKRLVPLTSLAGKQLRAAWLQWGALLGPRPFLCDASQVRRMLYACATDCGLPQGALNVRALRRARERELEQLGLGKTLLDVFMGRSGVDAKKWHNAAAVVRQFVHRETPVRSSARNLFHGQITRLERSGILVEVELKTAGELPVIAIITDTSCQSLRLEVGALVHAMIKAPWVHVGLEPPDPETLLPGRIIPDCGINSYRGRIETVRRDEHAREIMVRLPQGQALCALAADKCQPAFSLLPGTEVSASFSPLAVILTVTTNRTPDGLIK